jgi:calcineurin-like phosphoesterase
VPTADARVLPGGTAFISDVGMTGSRNGVLGARRDQVLESFITQMPIRFEGAEGDVWIDAVAVEVRDDGLAASIDQVLVPTPE